MSNLKKPDIDEVFYIRNRGRVLGPFSIDKLRSLRARGQFSRVHEVSTDRITWSAGSSLDHLFAPRDAAASRSPTVPLPAIANAPRATQLPAERQSAGADANERPVWFYRINDQQFGPATTTEMQTQIGTGRLGPLDFVWKDGLMAWSTVEETAELNAAASSSRSCQSIVIRDRLRRNRRAWAVRLLAFTATVLVVLTLYLGLSGKLQSLIPHGKDIALNPTPAPLPVDAPGPIDLDHPNKPLDGNAGRTDSDLKDRSPASGRAVRIQSLDDMALLENAVGRVEVCRRQKFSNGTIIERPMGNGSGFCVTSTGYMLTNRHVVEGLYAERDAEIQIDESTTIPVREELVPVVFFKQLRCNATVVHVSSRFDFAILKVARSRPCPYFGISSGDDHRMRTEVAALGFPGVASRATEEEAAMLNARFASDLRGAAQKSATVYLESRMPESAFVLSVEDGRVSKLDKESSGWSRITHSAKIFAGNSGGPLVNQAGQVLGINTMLSRDIKSLGKDETGKDVYISDGNLYFAYSTGQFRQEIEEHVADPIEWLPSSN